MKKYVNVISVLAGILGLCLGVLVACGRATPTLADTSTDTITSTDTDTITSTDTDTDTIKLGLPEFEGDIQDFRVLKAFFISRIIPILEETEEVPNFLSDEEVRYLEEGFDMDCHSNMVAQYQNISCTVQEMYYPVLCRWRDGILLIYTSQNGNLNVEVLEGSWQTRSATLGCGGAIHRNFSKTEKVLWSTAKCFGDFSEEDSEVRVWEFGEVVETFPIPEGCHFCGKAEEFSIYLFRNEEGELFGLSLAEKDPVCQHLASGVSWVLEASYRLNSDAWGVPLLQMEDGSVRAYCPWEQYGNEPDDPGHLVALEFEGGYR